MTVRQLLFTATLTAATLMGVAAVEHPRAQEDEYLGLPDAPGREEVAAYCGACHSLKLVVQQGLTRKGWEDLLVWMYEEQEMPELEPDEEKLVLDYLAKYVNPETQKQRLRERGIIQ